MSTDLPTTFGKVLRQHRQRRKWSQMRLATEAGIHLNALGNIERGQRTPSLHTVFLLSKALAIPAARLVQAVEEASPKL